MVNCCLSSWQLERRTRTTSASPPAKPQTLALQDLQVTCRRRFQEDHEELHKDYVLTETKKRRRCTKIQQVRRVFVVDKGSRHGTRFVGKPSSTTTATLRSHEHVMQLKCPAFEYSPPVVSVGRNADWSAKPVQMANCTSIPHCRMAQRYRNASKRAFHQRHLQALECYASARDGCFGMSSLEHGIHH